MKVGFIGVGSMGGPMCRNIVKKSNHPVMVYDLNASAVKACTDLGATSGATIAEVAAWADVVMTSLPMPKDVEAVALGAGGIGDSAKPGTIYFDLSTNSPTVVKAIAEKLKAKGITMLDSPVSGGVVGAEKGTIAIMVGGDEKAFESHLPLLQSFSATVIYMGGLGSGTVAKLVNNMMAFANMASAAEGLMLGTSAGLDPKKLIQVIANSSGGSNAFTMFSQRALSGDHTAAFAMDLAYKDLHLALELSDQIMVPTPMGAQAHMLLRQAKGMGLGRSDTSAMIKVYETNLGRNVRDGGK